MSHREIDIQQQALFGYNKLLLLSILPKIQHKSNDRFSHSRIIKFQSQQKAVLTTSTKVLGLI